MLPDLENLEARIDRDRRQQERGVLGYLLSLFGRAREHAYAALRVGLSPLEAVRDVLAGSYTLGLPGGAPRLAVLMRAADLAGFRRTVLVMPGRVATVATPAYAPIADYGSLARQGVGQMLGTLQRKLIPVLSRAAGLGLRKQQDAARDAFVGGGYVESATSKAWLLESAAVTLTGLAWGNGWFNGWQRPDVRDRLKGFRYSSVLDNATTEICRAYEGVKLPTDHPWWRTHWPMNHYGCRAVALPLWRDFTPTPQPPTDPAPMLGFGAIPAAALGLVRAA